MADSVDRRLKRRRLPNVDVPAVEDQSLRQHLEGVKEHLRMYEGDSGAPKERFVTIDELEAAGLIATKIKRGYASITEAAGQVVPTVGSQSIVIAGGSTGGGVGGGVSTFSALSDTSVAGISSGQGVAWNGTFYVPTTIPDFNVDVLGAAKYDMLFKDTLQWKNTNGALQWNPDLNFLQLANAHSVNWLNTAVASVELLNFYPVDSAAAELTHEFIQLEATTVTLNAAGVYSDVTGAVLAGASMNSGNDVMIFAQCDVRKASGGANIFTKITGPGGDLTKSESSLDTKTNGLVFGYFYGYMGKVTADGTDVQLEGNGPSGIDTYYLYPSMIALDLTELGSSAQYTESTTEMTNVTGGVWTATNSSLTFGDGVKDFIVFWGSQVNQDNPLQYFQFRLNDGAGTIHFLGGFAGGGTVEIFNQAGHLAITGHASATWTLEYFAPLAWDLSDVTYTSLCVIDLDAFEDHLATEAAVPNPGWINLDIEVTGNTTVATAAAEDWFIIGSVNTSAWNVSTEGASLQLQSSLTGSGGLAGILDLQDSIVTTPTNTPRPFTLFEEQLAVANATDFYVQIQHATGNPPNAANVVTDNASISAFTWNLVGAQSETFTVGDPVYPTRVDGTLVGLKNSVGVNWKNSTDADVEFLNFVETFPLGEPAADPYFASVTLLVTAQTGVVGAETFVSDVGGHTLDSSTHNIGTGVAEISDTWGKFSDRSLYIDDQTGGANQAGFDLAASTDFDFASGDFTVEYHWRSPDATASAGDTIGMWEFGGTWGWKIQHTHTGVNWKIIFSVSTDGSTNNLTYAFEGGISTGAVDTWYHIAVSRVGNTMYYFWDGIQVATKDVTGLSIFTPGGLFYVGSANQWGGSYEFYLDNIRLTKGVGRYTDSFTPPGAPYQGSSGVEGVPTFFVGDPVYVTQIDGLTTNITSAATNVEGTLTVTGLTDFTAVVDFNNDVELNTGKVLTIWDPTDTDNAKFSHDGTDFQTVLLTTANWDVSGLTNAFRATGGVDIAIRDGGAFVIFDATNASTVTVTSATGHLFFTGASMTGDFAIVGFGSGNVWIKDGAGLKISDTTNVNFATFASGASHFTTDFSSQTDWQIDGLSGGVDLFAGTTIRMRSSVNSGHGTFGHDDTDFFTTMVNVGDWNVTGLAGGQVSFDGSLAFSEKFNVTVTTVTATSYTAATEHIILVDDDTAGSTVTITLPTAATANTVYHIKKLGTTATVIVDGDGTETIDGALTITLTAQYESVMLVSNGTFWSII